MELFNEDRVTHECRGNIEARKDPLESAKAGRFVPLKIPYHHDDAPPETGEHEVAVRVGSVDGFGGKWEVVPDFRGVTYWRADGTEVTIDDPGVTVPTDALTEPLPPTQDDIDEQKIVERVVELAGEEALARRSEAIQSLKDRGDLSPYFVDGA